AVSGRLLGRPPCRARYRGDPDRAGAVARVLTGRSAPPGARPGPRGADGRGAALGGGGAGGGGGARSVLTAFGATTASTGIHSRFQRRRRDSNPWLNCPNGAYRNPAP